MFFSSGGAEIGPGPFSLRQQYRRLIQSAADSGIKEAAGFFQKTPREIHLLLSACRAEREYESRRLLLLARYIALAVHDPARLPDEPCAPLPDMTDDEIKQRLLSLARKGAST